MGSIERVLVISLESGIPICSQSPLLVELPLPLSDDLRMASLLFTAYQIKRQVITSSSSDDLHHDSVEMMRQGDRCISFASLLASTPPLLVAVVSSGLSEGLAAMWLTALMQELMNVPSLSSKVLKTIYQQLFINVYKQLCVQIQSSTQHLGAFQYIYLPSLARRNGNGRSISLQLQTEKENLTTPSLSPNRDSPRLASTPSSPSPDSNKRPKTKSIWCCSFSRHRIVDSHVGSSSGNNSSEEVDSPVPQKAAEQPSSSNESRSKLAVSNDGARGYFLMLSSSTTTPNIDIKDMLINAFNAPPNIIDKVTIHEYNVRKNEKREITAVSSVETLEEVSSTALPSGVLKIESFDEEDKPTTNAGTRERKSCDKEDIRIISTATDSNKSGVFIISTSRFAVVFAPQLDSENIQAKSLLEQYLSIEDVVSWGRTCIKAQHYGPDLIFPHT